MTKLTKRNKANEEIVDKKVKYDLAEAITILKKGPATKFDQTVEIAMKLNLEHASNPIRGTISLPNGTGKSVKVAVFCKGDHEKEAKEAGADAVGGEELIEKVAGGWFDFDVAVATPDMMRFMAKLGKVLGPRGLMPNPKSGTVTTDVKKAIIDLKAGKIEFRMDKQSGVKGPVGKLSFDDNALIENIKVFVSTVVSSNLKLQKPQNVKSIAISSTMGPGLKLEKGQF